MGTADKRRGKRRQRRRWVWRTGAFVLLALVLYVAVTFLQVVAAARAEDTDRSDAIVVLGAAQYDGRPSPVLRERLDHALALYRSGVASRIVLTGGKRAGDRFTEAYSGYRYLAGKGVPTSDLVVVTDGSSTWDSLRAAERVLRRAGAGRVTLVSNGYHALRLRGIAGEIGLDAGVSPTGGSATLPELLRETGLVAIGRVVGYGRLLRVSG
ncbi:MAG: YdcF family protein [Actinobacteria bacterium]|nr:YdcF family protein [Actinomycetota bacterium]